MMAATAEGRPTFMPSEAVAMRRNGKLLIALSCAALTLAVAAPSHAVAARDGDNEPGRATATLAKRANLAADAGWRTAGVDSRWGHLATVTTKRPVLLTITDAFCEGDVMAVRDNGKLIGTTSDAPRGRCSRDDIGRPWPALASDRYSHGAFLLKPGRTHHLEIRLTVNPFGGAGVFVRMDSPGAVWGRVHRTLAQQ
ncbi:MAG: hypothetical protein MUF33_14555 [Candidatus Nanopelagicales bacterium]|jgi:hypothetical protein|nr:hypothetical protein [Candidatus Nanopelagicales bacterium]